MDLNDPVQRGEKAAEIVNNPLWEESFTELERVYIEIIKDLPPDDDKRLRHYKQALVGVGFIKGHFETVLAQGELAANEAKLEEESKISRLADYVRKF